jgi:hypothetical protein
METQHAGQPSPTCGSPDQRLSWQTFANQTRHIRCDCRRCGRFLNYVRQTPANLLQVEVEAAAGVDAAGVKVPPLLLRAWMARWN